jgi:acyl carrier protein
LNDLWPDSLDVAELMIEYGDGLEFTIPEEAYRTMRSVEDAVEYIDAHLRQLKQS